MKTRRLIAAAIAILMIVAAIPAFSLAEGFHAVTRENRQMSKLEKAWQQIEAAEAKAIAAGLSRKEVINAAYQAALNFKDTSLDSFGDFTEDGFFFSVDGMLCAYNYHLRNELERVDDPSAQDTEKIVITAGKDPEVSVTKGHNGPYSRNVLLVGPYYGHDVAYNLTNFKKVAQSIANSTGGSYTLLQSTQASAANIVNHIKNKGVVIFDTHGSYGNGTTYLTLTTFDGITSDDYAKGWAAYNGNIAYIDGRFIQGHINGRLSNCFVHLASCFGMKQDGNGTTGRALIAAGASAVYGYSKDPSHLGVITSGKTFWNEMMSGNTVAQAYKNMVNRHGYTVPVSVSKAYQIIMSEVDPFPANADAPQTVYCEWRLHNVGTMPDPTPVPTAVPTPTPAPTPAHTPDQDGFVQLGVRNLTVASEQNGEDKAKVIDGNNNTIWHTKHGYAAPASERYITIELNAYEAIKRFEYQPRLTASNGRVNNYKISISSDGQNWTQVSTGNWANNSALKTVEFENPVVAKFVKLEGVTTHGNSSGEANMYMSAAEIRLFGNVNYQVGVSSVNVASEQGGEGREKAFDGNNNTLWHTKWHYAAPASERYITVELLEPTYIGRYEYQSGNGSNGRVNQYRLSVSTDGKSWTEVSSGSWANNNTLKKVEFANPVLAKFVKLEGVTTYGNSGGEANMYMNAAEIRVFRPETEPSNDPSNKLEISGISVATEQLANGEGREKAIDGSNDTMWHTRHRYASPLEERYITLELAAPAQVSRYEYQPRMTAVNGRVNNYKIYTSMDGRSWTAVSSGTWSNDNALKTVYFETPVMAKFVKLEGVTTYGSSSADVNKYMSAAEIRVFGTTAAVQQEYLNFSIVNRFVSMDNNTEWGNGEDKHIPRSISYQLLANGQPTGSVQTFSNPFGGNKNWDDRASWTNIPKFDENGNAINYTVKVVNADSRWLLTENNLVNTSGNNFRFELRHRWAMARINVNIAWKNAGGGSVSAPAGAQLEVKLMKRGNGQDEVISTLILSSANNFRGTFKSTAYTNDGSENTFLPRVFLKDANGNVIYQNGKPVLDSNAYYLVENWLNLDSWTPNYPESILASGNYSSTNNGQFSVTITNVAK